MKHYEIEEYRTYIKRHHKAVVKLDGRKFYVPKAYTKKNIDLILKEEAEGKRVIIYER